MGRTLGILGYEEDDHGYVLGLALVYSSRLDGLGSAPLHADNTNTRPPTKIDWRR